MNIQQIFHEEVILRTLSTAADHIQGQPFSYQIYGDTLRVQLAKENHTTSLFRLN
ncbi:MAG: hypothetical protein ACE5R6_05520 [Candidatus Heimdallarchaeota archaeon]